MKTIHFIIPLAGRYETLKRFLGNFEKVCLLTAENVKLAVILFKVQTKSGCGVLSAYFKLLCRLVRLSVPLSVGRSVTLLIFAFLSTDWRTD